MKVVAIRFCTVDPETFERISEDDIWHNSSKGDLESFMDNDVNPWAKHNGFLVEVTGVIYSNDGESK